MTTETSETVFDPAEFAAEHGLAAKDLERYPLDGYTRTMRGGRTEHPYQGCSIWLLPDTPGVLDHAAIALRAAETSETAGYIGFGKLCDGLSQVVAGHDMPGYAQFYGDPAAAEQAPSTLLVYIYTIVMTGEVPEDRPNASARGRSGGSTRKSLARTTSDSNDARPRLVNG